MTKTQVSLPEAELAALRRLAAEQGVSVSELVRRAVKQVLSEHAPPPTGEVRRRARAVAGKYRSGRHDIGRRHDDYLTEPALDQVFRALAAQWRAETAFMSSVTDMAMHPAYQQIIGMGRQALPLILRELELQPDHWFWALTAITGEQPVPPEDAGDIEKMARAWLKRAEQRGWLPPR